MAPGTGHRHGSPPSAQASDPTAIVASTAIEMLCRLYVSAHATKGDFEQHLPVAADSAVPADQETQRLLLQYFQADFAVGLSLVRTAVSRGWATERELIAGVSAMTPDELIIELLASTTLEPKDQAATAKLVALGLADSASRKASAAKIARRNSYSRRDVEFVLAEPERVHREFSDLLKACASNRTVERATAKRLGELSSEVGQLIFSHPRARALVEVTGGWTLKDDTDPLVLAPSSAFGSFVFPRLLDDGRVLLAFGPPRDRDQPPTVSEVAEFARALGNEQRLAILRHISDEAASGQALARTLGLTTATVHYHTSLLRSVGLITSARDAHSVVHSLDSERLLTALAAVANSVLSQDVVAITTKP